MHKYVVIVVFIISFFSLFYIFKSKLSIATMQYFPIDEQVFFDDSVTDITIISNDAEIEWSISSTSSEIAYLRQDVSLLFENGKFKGIQSMWKQHLDHLELQRRFKQQNSSLLQAISFHHGEIHYPDEQISSIQKMTSDHLYFIKDDGKIHAFRKPSNTLEKNWKIKLNEMTEQQLFYHWNMLINHFNIQEDEYDSFPLTKLIEYEEATLPNRSKKETEKIIGQLWEGLYKNYIVLLKEKENEQNSHYVPLIMIAKDNSHLLVIYELNNQKQKLIQRLD